MMWVVDEDAPLEAPTSHQKQQQTGLCSSQCRADYREFCHYLGQRRPHRDIGIFQVGARKHFKTTLKDWVFSMEDFLSKALEVIRDKRLDHDE
jgi:hypothetical protein